MSYQQQPGVVAAAAAAVAAAVVVEGPNLSRGSRFAGRAIVVAASAGYGGWRIATEGKKSGAPRDS